MHCIVKKTLNLIINSGNNYLVKVKGNQRNLRESVKKIIETTKAVSIVTEEGTTRGREEKRETKVYLPTLEIPNDWPNLKRIIYVERTFKSKKDTHNTQSYYISSLRCNNATKFAKGIRGHWLIENRLHWVKDAIQKEDSTRHKSGYASRNMSIIRNIAINIFRGNRYNSVKHGSLFFASNVNILIKLLFRT